MVADQHGLDFGGVHEVELGLRAPEAPEVQAELCQTRGGARLATGAVVATVGQRFELFFRLAGTSESRVLVETSPSWGRSRCGAVRSGRPICRQRHPSRRARGARRC